MMSKIVALLMVVSIVCALACKSMDAVSQASIAGAKEAVNLLLGIGGAICLWSGIMEVMNRSGLSRGFARLLGPLITLLFGSYGKDNEAREAISQNMAANLLGLGNAATPAGLRAAKRLQELSRQKGEPPHAVFLLIIINTASMQLLPTTIAAVRAQHGAAQPYDILPAVWLASAASVLVGVLAAKTLRGARRGR